MTETLSQADGPTTKPTKPVDATDYSTYGISALAAVVKRDWKKVYFGAVPYLQAMFYLGSIKDNFYADSGTEVVNYFLANAQTWRGPTAKAVKAELNKRVKAAR